MPTEILMPALSPTMEEGTLAKWLVKEGDSVASGDIIAEIETDKATMEFEAVEEGVIGKILIEAGTDAVKVNTPIAVMLGEGESASDIGAPSKAAPQATQEAAAAPTKAPSESSTKTSAPPAPKADGQRVFASPLARRIAAEKGIDLTQISGSGPHGRIVKADLADAKPAQASAAPADSAAKPAAGAAMPAGPTADQVAKMYDGRDYEEVKLDGMRKTVAARLTEAKQTIPHFYLRREVQLDALMKFRGDLNKQLEARGVKLSVNDFIIKACAMALQAVPDCNAVWAGDRMLRLKPSDVAVAVAVEGGLFTPVLKDAHLKSLSALSAEMKDLAGRARNKKLAPHEYIGGAMAISNLGMFGIENFDAVINPPHGSILAVGAGLKKPVVGSDGELKVATVMSMTLSVDHRVIDGALGAEFLKEVVAYLENPVTMLA
ncbi:pyruvate dehydrogenase complex dihydrolipoamide acetyltransferase [Roseinatronobacter bogoriensis]|uniref:Acetyltransferase component of pyruvate dehydrogenase complex n=1 Tax=Roseinatronobacter bogoriensis subsp. barguzinensis TaxID=441209 RepID=A0A2K8KAT3_9RHOB|nr:MULTISPECIES: pyruvate dehydrogenase complex dihydrolipoamide acetyltransferase [Rhodobaca]ATX66561.1 pyruvate dehydrogenase complex dihydrolipoamide acetyltransferase [Rhodobaca barguzinensis]MBB4207726.1 pyruvate dehydrogenase E2 component (dihydrolipoamide acetyltransferase) [Rhodobaca bogoriensis DSM 18756]TDW39967.1 pyruvate dehydrogenase E2 component (dihydrolipoamide acetyltransferase) [Rhodobaca barguzinensis]TDY70880.1 pyruvate dehydrogenase E2 component (dihydrolipoamide acetyltran